MITIAQTDWLASRPVFYDEVKNLVSSNINDVLPGQGLEPLAISREGLYNFLDYGYSVFGQTAIESVRLMPPHARIVNSGVRDQRIQLVEDADPVEKWLNYRLSESDVIELIRERVQAWEASLPSNQEIVLPLSGGFDSRLLLWCVRDKSRIHAFTYGISNKQEQSSEVVNARWLSEKYRLRWSWIPLQSFHNHFDIWHAHFGISTHAHGMYQIEFYSKICAELPGKHAVLSGIIGDAWAGSIQTKEFNSAEDLCQLGHTHGMRLDPSKLLRYKRSTELRDKFFLNNREQLKDPRFQVVASMRFKTTLLSYLLEVPRWFKLDAWSPFLDIDIAMSMLNLPSHRRKNRQWQTDFFSKIGLSCENIERKKQYSNSLDYQGLQAIPVPQLCSNWDESIFDSNHILWINKNIRTSRFTDARTALLDTPKLGGALRRMGLRNLCLDAYYKYLCLKPLNGLPLTLKKL